MEKINKEINLEEKFKEMSNKFWHDIFNRKWRNCDKFNMNIPCNHYDREDIETTFEICRLMAYSLCKHNSCFCLKYKHLPFSDEALDWLAIGWGDPHVTSNYGYCLFDFSNDLVYITGDEVEARVITIGQALSKIYS